MATDSILSPWHPVNNPECTNCHGLARPVRPKPRVSDCSYAPVQIVLRPETAIKLQQAALRRRLRELIHQVQLPQAEFASTVLGVDEVTLYRYLSGEKIPRSKETYLRGIEHISRDGAYVHVIYRACPPRPRWDSMEKQRARAVA